MKTLHPVHCAFSVLLVGLLFACGPLAQLMSRPPLSYEDYAQAVEVREKRVPVVPSYVSHAGANFEIIDPESPEIQAAMKEFEKTGRAPRIRKDGFLYVPYDGFQTNLYCKPTRLCRVELALGEVPIEDGVYLGDSARWWWGIGVHGNREGQVHSVLFKPLWSDSQNEETCQYSTNMVVQTSLRTYQLGLICNERRAYTRVLRFYYPQEILRAWKVAEVVARSAAQKEADLSDVLPEIDLSQLNIDHYRISGDKPPWRPVRAFDDGYHVYLQMREKMKSTEAPAVFVRTDEGKLGLVNYRHIGPYIQVDRLFKEAVLIDGKGRRQKRVSILYRPRRR